MITKAKEEIPEIEWERGDLLDTVGHTKSYNAYGKSKDGRWWDGTWEETCGDVEIRDIESVEIMIERGEEAIYDNLISKNIGKMFGSLHMASVEHFLKTGKINGSFRLALHKMLRERDSQI